MDPTLASSKDPALDPTEPLPGNITRYELVLELMKL